MLKTWGIGGIRLANTYYDLKTGIATMTAKEEYIFQPLVKNLLPPFIAEATDETLKHGFLKDSLFVITPSKDIRVGDEVTPNVDVEHIGGFTRTPYEVTQAQANSGIKWHLTGFSKPLPPGAHVTVYYRVSRNGEPDVRSATGHYTVENWKP